MIALERAISRGSTEESLAELVRLRVSQITGRAFCGDMHTLPMRAGAARPNAGWRAS